MSMLALLAFLAAVPQVSASRTTLASSALDADGQPRDRVNVGGKPLELDARILVVGAGPSGLHMARMLQKKGYHDITILEKTDRVGGKSFTLYFDHDNRECQQGLDEPDWGCAQMEMGTCFLHNGYDRVRNLNNELGLHSELPPIIGQTTRDGKGGTGTEQVQAQAIMSREHFGGEARPFKEYMGRLLKKVFRQSCAERMSAVKRELSFLASVEKYNLKHHELMRYAHPGFTFPERPSKAALAELSKTFQDFLVDNNLTSLTAVLQVAQAAQGYGYLTGVPAYYGLLWITPDVLCGSAMYILLSKLRVHEGWFKWSKKAIGYEAYKLVSNQYAPTCATWLAPGRLVTEITTMLPQGYQAIWDKLYESHFTDKVEFMVQDLSITRDCGEGKTTHPVCARYTVPGADGPVAKSEAFDFLVYSAPQRLAHKYIEDLTPVERELFSNHWEGATLRTQVWSSPPIPTYSDESSNVGLLYVSDNIVDGKQGTWMGDNSINIFRQPPDFSDRQLKRAIQYWGADMGDLDRQPPATSDVHSRVPGREKEKQALRTHFQTLGAGNEGARLQDELQASLHEWAPASSESADWLNSQYAFPWPYFSRYNNVGVGLGKPWDLFEAQGSQDMPHTWYVGGSVVFESVNDIISYNLQLLHKHGQWQQGFESKPLLHHWTTCAELEACKNNLTLGACPQPTL